MKKIIFSMSMLMFASIAWGETHYFTPTSEVIIPDSSIAHPGETGLQAHTDLIITKPLDPHASDHPRGETPASMACIYGLTAQVPGCPIHGTTALPNAGWGAIALVDAYYNGDAEHDLGVFSTEFGLPACTTANGCFHQVYASGTRPPDGWQDEQVLDIEWAHAMAPNAKIYLVEAASGSLTDLMQAENVASELVRAAGGGVISNSWSMPEFAGEAVYDVNFQTPGIVYVASSGDYSAPARYPSSSPFIVSAGGTSLVRDANGNFVDETAWSTIANPQPGSKSGGSGGPSLYEPRPAYQNIVQKVVGNVRGTPDIAFEADPKSGVSVYSTYHGGWLVDGGTSVSSPSLAGIINSAGHQATSTQDELSFIYRNAVKNFYWHDIISGNNGYPALAGYDFTTGLGSPHTYQGK